MNYRINTKNGDKISALGFGCMRFPKDDDDLERQIIYAIENGINYFDTAYIYPNSEERLGRVLSKGYRDKVKIATKIPPYFVNKYEDLDKILSKQLARLKTDYIDYYFIHMLTEVKTWDRLVGLGILKWIEEKKAEKKIRNVGFSYHGGKIEFEQIIDAHDWDFCMMQYNYFDENNQAGRSGLSYAAQKGIPIMVMEPLRGGMLAGKLPKNARKVWDEAYIKRSPAEWAFTWVFNHPEVLTVLSGMNSIEMIKENIKVASKVEPGMLKEQDFELYKRVSREISSKTHVNCTGCNYCMPCPAGVDIPLCFACWNENEIIGKLQSKAYYVLRTDKHNASLCTECGKCERHCPQKIAIRKELKEVTKSMEGITYKPLRYIVRKVMKF